MIAIAVYTWRLVKSFHKNPFNSINDNNNDNINSLNGYGGSGGDDSKKRCQWL